MANCIRYIINFSGQRVQNKKSSIKVLEVQPDKGSELNKDEVRKWFPGNTFPSDSAIDITTMSTAEFIGKIEDINEIYDLVYIGASLEGFHTVGSGSGQTTAYNDTAMNGLIYSNIGDRYVSQISLAGLLDRDYSSSTFTQGGDVYNKIANNTTTKTFRFSGNDITATKQE